ncbi:MULTISPECIES: DsbA family protein [Dietzia]|uniref:Protein-disulfide isomerase n=1 Tax=Dietzia cinnamea TaxID=321318 RepID=A0A4R3ZRG4_9ACTN|nr:thioredoxin domain-containing protein [Dietzia cinnamea]MBB1020360.1 thioredoxin domain-containing protein [Dietzia sp. E1]TCW22751.1 protein-disulfide isomerase [Dietzia cinnamea]
MTTDPATSRHTLEGKYRRSRILNGVLGAVVAFLAVVVVAQMLPGQSPTSGAPAAAETASASGDTAGPDAQAGGDMDFVRRDADDPKAIGAVDAPVVLTEWIDLRCPFCASFSRDTLPTLIDEYVDTGRVRIEFTDVAYFGEQSEDAQIAAQAAANQDKYVDYITAVFDAAPDSGHPDLTRDVLIDFAEQVDMPDMDAFRADLDDPGVRAQAENETRTAQQLGVTAVPFFVAGQIAMSGAQPLENFRAYLDDALAAVE